MRAGVLWMVMACLSDGEVMKCSVKQIIKVSKLSKVNVSCPSIVADSSKVKYQLLFNLSCTDKILLERVRQCASVSVSTDSAQSLFTGQFEVTANNSGKYICQQTVIYPPPFREDCHITEVKVDSKIHDQILTENHSCPALNATGPEANQSCPDRSPVIPELVMWVGCGILLVYSLSITCITSVIWRRSKKDDEDTNVYVNTRPGELWKPCKA